MEKMTDHYILAGQTPVPIACDPYTPEGARCHAAAPHPDGQFATRAAWRPSAGEAAGLSGPRPPLRLVTSDLIGEDVIRLTYVPA